MKRLMLGVTLSFLAIPALANPLLLVGNKGENTVSIIDLESGEELARPDVSGRAPHEIAPSPDGSQFAVVNYGDNDIDIFDVKTRAIVQTIDLGDDTRPHGLKWLTDDRIIATTEGNQSIVVLPPDRTVRSVKTNQQGTHMVVVDPTGQTAFTANMGAGTVSRIDLSDGTVLSAAAGTEPEGIDITPDGTEVWVSSRGDNHVRVYDAASLALKATIEVGNFPLRLVISPDGQFAVTSDLADGGLSVIDTSSRDIVRTIPVSGSQSAGQVTLLFSNDGSRLYAAETGTNTVAEIDFKSGEVLRRLSAGQQGDGLAIIH